MNIGLLFWVFLLLAARLHDAKKVFLWQWRFACVNLIFETQLFLVKLKSFFGSLIEWSVRRKGTFDLQYQRKKSSTFCFPGGRTYVILFFGEKKAIFRTDEAANISFFNDFWVLDWKIQFDFVLRLLLPCILWLITEYLRLHLVACLKMATVLSWWYTHVHEFGNHLFWMPETEHTRRVHR